MIGYLDHPKVKQAKRLLIEADQEVRTQLKAKEAAAMCRCSHRRDDHTASHSINYTGGVCKVKGCSCMNFLQR